MLLASMKLGQYDRSQYKDFCISIIANTATGKPHHAITNQHLALSVKRTGTQRGTKSSPRYMYCMYCGWQKGTSRDEATSNSEEIKPIALSIVKLCLDGGISQLVSQHNILVNRNILKFHRNFVWDWSEDILGLGCA